MNHKENIRVIINDITNGMNPKEKLKFYINLTEGTLRKSTDLLLLEKAKENLCDLKENLIDVLMEEYYIENIDRNN